MPDQILPDSRLHSNGTPVGSKLIGGVNYIPIFCANCGADGGWVPEVNMTFAFYLCNSCHERHGAPANTLVIPDRIFWQKVKEAQIERYGHELSAREVRAQLDDPNSLMSLLARSRASMTPRGST
jgi:hypothetical protein